MTRAARLALLADITGVAAPTLLLASLFPPDLMFAATTAAGGDLGSHNFAAAVARELLLTEHRLTSWVPGSYCGFPLFQMYFPLPFVLIVLGSLFSAPEVAFKVTSILGVLALPSAAYFCVRARHVPFPGPALAASLVLAFLLQAGNSAWGGNLQSTLAGEFAFSISLPLALVYFGLHRRSLDRMRWGIAAGALVAALALTHAYTVLWAALTAGLVSLGSRNMFQTALRTALVFAAGGAMCAFWLLPLLWYAPWTTAFHHVWLIGSFREVVPPLLWPVVCAAAGTPLFLWWRDRAAFRAYRCNTGLLWAGALAAAMAYLAAPSFGIVDIRFLPFLQLLLCLLAAAGAGHVLSRWAAPALWVPIVFLGTMLGSHTEAARIGSWIRWNYEGFERKAMWPVYRAITDHLRGDAADPRVGYEHSPEHEALGTIRAFENLPLFSGRSTLEGVNMQASVTSPFVFYVQSEISEVMSCPFGEWGCSRTDLAAGVEHLAMMNVSELIVRSPTVKTAAAQHPRLVRTATFGPYEIYRIKGHRQGYAVPLGARPYLVITPDWKTEAYRWFKRARSADAIPVFADDPTEGPRDAFAGTFSRIPTPMPAAHERVDTPEIVERVEAERIRISGLFPGQPLLIRVSFHPGWQSTTGERVWLAGPGFMLVFPNGRELELVYSNGAAGWAGRALTAVALSTAGLLFVLAPRAERWRRRTSPAAATASKGQALLIGICVACALGAVGAGARARFVNADALYLRGIDRLDAGDTDGALVLFQSARARAPLSNTAIHSTYFEAIALYRARRWREAQRAFGELVERFPEAQAAAESSYHVGLCAEELHDSAGARQAYAETIRRFAATSWAALAADRLAAMGGAGHASSAQ